MSKSFPWINRQRTFSLPSINPLLTLLKKEITDIGIEVKEESSVSTSYRYRLYKNNLFVGLLEVFSLLDVLYIPSANFDLQECINYQNLIEGIIKKCQNK